jgi:(p)ppGpp synthase/HD superfamily hydrolase
VEIVSTFDLDHAFDVASRLNDPADKLVALFHDAVEDGLLTTSEIIGLLGEDIATSVFRLTRGLRGEAETYSEYIDSLARSGDDRAMRVKMADLSANLERSDEEHKTLRTRYTRALSIMAAAERA